MIDWFHYSDDNIINLRHCDAPYDMIYVGSCPYDGLTLKTAQNFDVFLNFCENVLYSHDMIRPRNDTLYAWVPIDELEPWGIKPFIDAKKILDHAFENNLKTYVHCASGTNRSPLVTMAWLMSLGHNLLESAQILCDSEKDAQNFRTKYLNRIDQGFISDSVIDVLSNVHHENSGIEVLLK